MKFKKSRSLLDRKLGKRNCHKVGNSQRIKREEEEGATSSWPEKAAKVQMSYATVRIEPLNKENYDTWKIQVQALLIKNETWKYVCGKCVRPQNGEEATTWEENDEKAKSDLILSISPSELQQIKNCNTSKEVWDKLQSVYQSCGPARQAMLLKSLILTKMQNGDDMRDHVQKFFEVVDKLNEMQLVIIDELLAILLLYSIPDEYETVRIAIES